jgi:hypothetical protein
LGVAKADHADERVALARDPGPVSRARTGYSLEV